MLKKAVIILTVLWAFNLLAQADIKIEVKAVKDQFILGEPCYVKIVIDNGSDKAIPTDQGSFYDESSVLSFKIEGPRRKECDFLPRPVADRLPGCGKKIESGGKVEWETEIGILGLYNVGKFKVWVEYDPSRISRFFGGKDTIITNCNYYDKPIKSNVAEFEFIKPTGIDLEVYEKHHNSCNQITLTPEDLLQKYPTSTYAGYVLAEYPVELALQGYSCLDHSEECMRKWYDRGGGEESIKNRIKEAKEAMRKYNDYAKLFLELHPDFNLNGLIRKKYIMCLGFTGEEEEAQRQLETLSKGCGKEAEEAKNYLAKKSERRGGLEKKINGQTNTKE